MFEKLFDVHGTMSIDTKGQRSEAKATSGSICGPSTGRHAFLRLIQPDHHLLTQPCSLTNKHDIGDNRLHFLDFILSRLNQGMPTPFQSTVSVTCWECHMGVVGLGVVLLFQTFRCLHAISKI